MLKNVVAHLKKRKLPGWQVRWGRKRSFQSFLAKETLECRRSVETESCLITIYEKRPAAVQLDPTHTNGKSQHGEQTDDEMVLGLSTFKITPQTIDTLDEKINEALFSASLVSNKPFDLPKKPSSLPNVSIDDAELSEKTLQQLESRLLKAIKKEKQIRLSAAEFFVDRMETRLVNHRGLDVGQKESMLHTEFILLARNGDKENEYINRYSRRFLKDFDLEDEAAQSAKFARDATAATLPKTGTFPVLISDEPLDSLFNPLVARASARLRFNKMMAKEIGQSVLEAGEVKGDTITLWSNGLLKGATGSSRFDGYGTPARRMRLIEKNILKSYIADKRYSDYLKVPLTGEMANVEVEAGKTPFKTLLDPKFSGAKTIYHLQAFSAFEPNAITGAFSAEIRAGYEISDKGVRPIKGGSVSGVLQRDLLNCRLSKERVQREHVLVPKGVLFSQLTIAGS